MLLRFIKYFERLNDKDLKKFVKMRLSIEKRLRVISIYFKNNLHSMKNKYDYLSKLSALEGIFILFALEGVQIGNEKFDFKMERNRICVSQTIDIWSDCSHENKLKSIVDVE
jgi:hypothetical protein